MKRAVFFWLTTTLISTLTGQEVQFTLQQCYQLAVQNHPFSRQPALYDKSNKIQEELWDKNNLPQLNFSGQATYQSAVTELPIQIPGVSTPEIPQEQYRVGVDVSQVIYGGGLTERQKILETHNLGINKKSTESELYKLKERVSQVYLGILLSASSLDVYKLSRDDMEARLKRIESMVKGGMVLPINATVLKAEILKVKQKEAEVIAQRKAFIGVLSILTGTDVPVNAGFIEPEITVNSWTYKNNRPEYYLFDLQDQKLDAMKNLTDAKRNPRVMAFGNVGYGRPGLNMFKEEAELFYTAGVKVSWNIWNWKQTDHEKQLLDIQKELIEIQKKNLDINVRASVQQHLEDMAKLTDLLLSDDTIISLRSEITKAAASQLENGVITSTEYLTEYNAEIQARLTRNLHRIQLLQAKTAYMAATGNL